MGFGVHGVRIEGRGLRSVSVKGVISAPFPRSHRVNPDFIDNLLVRFHFIIVMIR